MKQRRFYLGLIPILVAGLGGCANLQLQPASFRQTNTAMVDYNTPKLILLARRTAGTQSHRGLTVKIQPIPFSVVPGYRIVLRKSAPSLMSVLLAATQNTHSSPIHTYVETRQPVAALKPQQLQFEISVTNKTKNTLKINPTVLVFVDSRPAGSSNGFSMSLAPGSHQEAVITGPSSAEIFQGNVSGNVILYLNGINVDPFNPGKTVSFKWDYSYTMGSTQRSMPVMQKTVTLSEAQAQKIAGTIHLQN